MTSTLVVLNLVALSLAYLTWCQWTASRRRSPLPYPPGPTPKPLIGNLLEMPTKKPWLVYDQWSHTYASRVTFLCDIISAEAMGKRIVILTSLDATRDLLERRSAIYSDRPGSKIIELMGCDWFLSLLRYGDRWRAERRIVHEELHAGAVRKYSSIQTRRARQFIRQLLANPTNYQAELRTSFAGTTMKLFYGIDVQEKNDPYIDAAEDLMSYMMRAAIPGYYLVEYFGWLKYIPSWIPGAGFQRDAAECRRLEHKVRYEPLARVRSDLASGNVTNCVAHRLLRDGNSDDEKTGLVRNVAGVALLAAVDTTTSTLTTFMLSLLINPDAQNKAQAEIDAVMGNERLPTFEDRPRLPYIEAMISESLRWIPATPLGLAHSNIRDDEYKGYFIPEGSIILGGVWSILHDPEVYPDPDTFKPERFLRTDSAGLLEYDKSIRDPRVACFGFGRRICAGRFLVEDSLFITIATFLATLVVTPMKDMDGYTQMPGFDTTDGFTLFPKPFKCNIRSRSEYTQELLSRSITEE